MSRIAFGTASLHHLADAGDRMTLLKTARGAGITHFDTAPYYGFGLAEAALGEFARAERDVTIATKVGLYPPGGAEQSHRAVMVRKMAGKLIPSLSRPIIDLSVRSARDSLDASLRRLGRERIDLLLLHEPNHRLFAADEWQRWLESERDRIGAVGVSGEASAVLPFIRSDASVARVVQTRDSVGGREADALRAAGRSPQITFGHLARRASNDRVSATETLRTAIARHPESVLLVSTRQAARIPELAAAAD